MAAYKEDEDMVTSKSGRKRKKSAKLLEMEESFEVEKQEKISKKVIDTVKGLRAALAPMTCPSQKKKKPNSPLEMSANSSPVFLAVSPDSGPTKSSGEKKRAKKKKSQSEESTDDGGMTGMVSPKLKISVKRPESSNLETPTQFEVIPLEADLCSTESSQKGVDIPALEEKKKKKKKKKSADGIPPPELLGELPSSSDKSKKAKKKAKKSKKVVALPLNMDSLDALGMLGGGGDAFDSIDGEKMASDSLLPMYANTSEMAMKLKTSSERKASKVRKIKRKDDPLKSRKRRTPTAYMLWCGSYRQRVIAENPGIDFIQMSKRLGELWQALPEKQKMVWRRKAKKCAATGSTLISTGSAKGVRRGATLLQSGQQAAKRASSGSKQLAMAGTSTARLKRLTNGMGQLHLPESSFRVDCRPIDAAAHLTLLGESLELIGTRLKEHVGPCAVQGSVSVLLDSMICALAPLMCLINEIPELAMENSRTFMNTLDNIAYIMPGIG